MGFYEWDLARIHHEGHLFVVEACAPYLITLLRDGGVSGGEVLDLGCGSGALCQAMIDAGFAAHGVDISPAMIELAREIAPSAKLTLGSVHDAEVFAQLGESRFEAVSATGEILNYAHDPRAGLESLRIAFQRIYAALKPGGVFLFDLAGPGRAPDGKGLSMRDTKGWLVISQSSEASIEGAPTLTRKIVSFIRDGDVYRRDDETHTLRLFSISEVLAALHEAGFDAQHLDAGYPGVGAIRGWNAYLARKQAR